jgi:hypothetical protein
MSPRGGSARRREGGCRIHRKQRSREVGGRFGVGVVAVRRGTRARTSTSTPHDARSSRAARRLRHHAPLAPPPPQLPASLLLGFLFNPPARRRGTTVIVTALRGQRVRRGGKRARAVLGCRLDARRGGRCSAVRARLASSGVRRWGALARGVRSGDVASSFRHPGQLGRLRGVRRAKRRRRWR